ncbi:CYTH and CHAD domain-containing protein [Azoarcus olearius]|uniref:Adenylate cyclase n=1 Tax=Azoarcus sp. (strain BH72) TaxID=418699 RepID=A1K504_AZOSB|nr:CYTH and CHAD domain-containing protein [Azoarcus olearius]CAL93909.1 adenylate cyclase [Azoarcus olearius]
MSQEIELKLALPPSALPALRRHPLVAGAAREGKAETLDNTYFDTPDLTLKANRVAVRTRRQGRKWLQTVKCAATSSGGLSSRPEWEGPYNGRFDFSAVDHPEAARLLHKHGGKLTPLFSTRFRRETRLYSPREGVRILLMTDSGRIEAGGRELPICELELELVDGDPLDLLELACTLARDLPLVPNDISKAQRGYQLFHDQPVTPVRSEPPRLEADAGISEAFRALAFATLRAWQANAVAIAEGHQDPEFIHQLRVALRRLRALLRTFAPVLPADFHETWSARLREHAALLAEARDLDVLYTELLEPVRTEEVNRDEIDVHGLAALADDARTEARKHALKGLAKAGEGLAMLEFTAALHRLPDIEGDLASFARERLDRLRKRARRRFDAATDLAPARLHALRIAFKHLRYAVEFFTPLLARKAGARYLAALVKAQDTLGYLNDVDVARARLARWADDIRALQTAAAFVSGWHAPRYARYRRRVLDEARPLLWGRKPW